MMNKIKILAIDDDSDTLTVFRHMVRKKLPEVEVFTAPSGRKGIGLAALEDPDVIFLDIMMPEMDGFEVCTELKKDERLKVIPVVFYSANILDSTFRIKALEAGSEAYMNKPFNESELVNLIRLMVKIKMANFLSLNQKELLTQRVSEQTQNLEKELSRRKEAELVQGKTRQKLQDSQVALLNILEDLKVQNIARTESENKFRGITEQITDLIYMTDREGVLKYISPASFTLFGFQPHEMVENHFVMFLEKNQISLAQKKFRFVMKHGGVEKNLGLTMRRKDGSTFQGELQSAPYIIGEKMTGTLGLIRDISDRLLAEKKLKDTAQTLRDLTTHIQEMREEERKKIAQ
ncbi:MAG: response regulator, partial [Bacteroidia bacterium]|nr:response regulator [Bacteroidia bacterium]